MNRESTQSWLRWLAPFLLAAAVWAAYSNSTKNAFALDDWHSIEQNPFVRSLSNIPRFYSDASTFSVLPANIDYRPVLQTTYAINYWASNAIFGNGYDPRTWHWVNLALHAATAWGLFCVARRLLGPSGLAPLKTVPGHAGERVALAAALLFAVHPITSGCANYISARSSLLTAALLLPSLALYLASLGGRGWWLLPSLALYVLAMFTKVEAVAFLPVLVLAEFLFAPGAHGLSPLRRALHAPSLRRLAFALVCTIVYLGIWKSRSPLSDNAQRSIAGMDSGVYLLTQVRAWWYYIAELLAPVHLVADEANYPVSGVPLDLSRLSQGEPYYSLRRAMLDPRVWLAVSCWAAVGVASLRAVRSAPIVPFFVGMYLLMLAPTSSVVVLSEMVNEHRPYLPCAGLFVLGVLGLRLAAARLSPRPDAALVVATLLLMVPFTALTRERNTVWNDDLSLWADTAAKSPGSSRAQMNYGLALMRRAMYDQAESRFRQAISISPNYSYAHTNLGLVLSAKGDNAAAGASLDRAVACAPGDPGAYYWRGRTRAKLGDVPGAIADFQAAVERNSHPFNEGAALAAAYVRAGRPQEAQALRDRLATLDPAGFAAQEAAITALFPAAIKAESSMDVNNRAVALMGAARYPQAEQLFRQALEMDPANHYAQTNLGILLAAKGDAAGALKAHDAAVSMTASDPSPLYWRGRYFAAAGELDKALADFALASQRSGGAPRETAALIECFTRLNKPDEAARLLAAAEAKGQKDQVDSERAILQSTVFRK